VNPVCKLCSKGLLKMYKITFVVLPCLCTGCLLNLLLVVYLAVRSSNCIISVILCTLYSKFW